MNPTTEELDDRYIITKDGYTKGKLIRQPGGGFHCPHIGCNYTCRVQTGMGMHRKMIHGHKTQHSARYKRQRQNTKSQGMVILPPGVRPPAPRETRIESVNCKYCPRCGFFLEPVNVSMSITGSNGL